MEKNDTPAQARPSSTLELKVPPLALTVFTALLMWGLPAGMKLPSLGELQVALSAAAACVGLWVCVAGVVAFRQSSTTVDPRTPGAASSLVVSGIYRYTRNPMYLGFLLVLLGLAFYLGKLSALAFLPVFVAYLNELQIKPEERALRARFGREFDAYTERVRRWL